MRNCRHQQGTSSNIGREHATKKRIKYDFAEGGHICRFALHTCALLSVSSSSYRMNALSWHVRGQVRVFPTAVVVQWRVTAHTQKQQHKQHQHQQHEHQQHRHQHQHQQGQRQKDREGLHHKKKTKTTTTVLFVRNKTVARSYFLLLGSHPNATRRTRPKHTPPEDKTTDSTSTEEQSSWRERARTSKKLLPMRHTTERFQYISLYAFPPSSLRVIASVDHAHTSVAQHD